MHVPPRAGGNHWAQQPDAGRLWISRDILSHVMTLRIAHDAEPEVQALGAPQKLTRLSCADNRVAYSPPSPRTTYSVSPPSAWRLTTLAS